MFCRFFLALVISLSFANIIYAEPYGPTIHEIINKYPATRNFENLTENMSREPLAIRLGMTFKEVEDWVAKSKIYEITSKKDSIYHFVQKDVGSTFHDLSFDVIFQKGKVVMIKIHNLNDFEFDEANIANLKPLKEVKVNECWSRRNYIDLNALKNGYDFVFQTELGSPSGECMGSDRANVTIGQPGLLYPNHLKK